MPNPSSQPGRPAESRPGPSSTPSDDTVIRDALLVLLSRAGRGVLLVEEVALLRQHVETEIRAGDKARAELATMTHVARVNGRAHRYAYQAGEEARAELDKARQRAGDLSEEHDVRRKALADALDVGRHQSWDQLIEEARFDCAALARQRDTAEAALARVRAKVADWREWNPKEMSWAIRDVENAIANTPPPEPQDPATLDGPSATDDALARQRADGDAARLEAMDRTKHADLNRLHMRPTDDRPATRCTAGLLPEGPGPAEQCFQRAGHLGTHIGNRGARWSTEEGDTDAPGAPGA